jgi:hypothetical protein
MPPLPDRICSPGTLDKAREKWQFLLRAREFPTIQCAAVELWHEECETVLARHWPELMRGK